MNIKLFDRTLDALGKSLELRSQKHNIISSNIANADTPGYQAKTADFEASLANALSLDGTNLERTDDKHLKAGGNIEDVDVDIYNTINDVVRIDGNTVDRDAEMVSLAENQFLYDAAVELVKKKIGMIKYSINEGGGGH